MRRNDLVDIKAMDVKALKGKVDSARKELIDLVMDKNMKTDKDTSKLGKKKRDLAQMLTVLRQKEMLMMLESESHDEPKEAKV